MFSREGFTIDVVAGAVRKWVLTPTTTLPLALSLTWGPLFSRLIACVASRQRAATLRARIYWLAAASLVLAANDQLNKQSANNWVTDPTWNWDDEIVVVTGASGGVGASIAKRLIARNARTRIVIIDFAPLGWTVPRGARVFYYQCDLSDAAALKTTCGRIRAEVGHPTVLFNNAGLVRGSTVVRDAPHNVQLTMRTNLVAPFLLVTEFLPEMVRRNHGHIVNTGSMSSVIPAPTIVDYSASKAGLTALHEGLQLELKSVYNAPRVRLTLGIFSFISSPLFTSRTNESSFLQPLLNMETVSERLVDAVYSGYGSTIYLPGIMRYVTSLKGGPEWLFRYIRNQSLHPDYEFDRQHLRYGKDSDMGVGQAEDPLK